MKSVLLFSLVAVGALLVQTTVLPQALLGRASPDLLLIICVYLALRRHSVGGALGAFGLGYLQDAFSGSVIGLNAFGTTLVFAVIYLTSRRLWVENTVSRVVAVLVASFMSVEGLGSAMVRYVITDAVLAAALSPAVFAVLSRTQLLTVTEDG